MVSISPSFSTSSNVKCDTFSAPKKRNYFLFVIDPSVQDPIGKIDASIAAIHGHKGLAMYPSEVALTSHLS